MPSNVDFAFVAPGAVGVDNDHPMTVRFDLRIIDGERRAVPRGDLRKKIAICGFASSSRHRMPVTNPEWEIWGLNQLYRHIPRGDRWFDIHLKWEEGNVEGTDHPRWLAQFPGPIYFSEPPASVPTAVRFPIERMIAKFSDYYTSTVACMAALAIDEIDQRVETIVGPDATAAATRACYGEHMVGIFGIDLVVGSEYFEQKACVEYYIGQAAGRGIQVYLPPETALCRQRYRYGWQAEPESIIKLSEIQARKAALADRRNKCIAELQTIDGALQESDFNSQIIELRLRGAQVPYPTTTTG